MEQEKTLNNCSIVENSQKRYKLKLPKFLNPCASYSCGNWAFVNQQIIDNSEADWGLTSTFFTHNLLWSVKQTEKLIGINVVPHQQNNSLPLQYTLERLQSKNNDKCLKLSQLIARIHSLYTDHREKIKQIKIPTVSEQLQKLGNSKYIIFSAQLGKQGLEYSNVFISKSFLKQMGYNPSQFAMNCTKMKTILAQFVGNDNYIDCILTHLTYILTHLQFMLGIDKKFSSFEQIADCLNIRCFNKIQDVNDNTLYCYSRIYVPSITFAVVQILGVEARIPSNKTKKRIISQQEQMRIEMNQLKIINNIQGNKKGKVIRAVPIEIKKVQINQHSEKSLITDQQLKLDENSSELSFKDEL